MNTNYEIIKYENGSINVDIRYDSTNNTIWLTQSEIATIFGVNRQAITKQIYSVSSSEEHTELYIMEAKIVGSDGKTYKTKLYNLKMIEAISLRSKSNNSFEFIKWANKLIEDKKNNIYQLKSFNEAEIVTFVDGDFRLDVSVSPSEDTVWLTQDEIALLFETTKQNISKHINNIYETEEQDIISTVNKKLTVQVEGDRKVTREIMYYNYDIILSVGFKVNSKRGAMFRKWATNILREYSFKGYVLNPKRINNTTDNLINLRDEVNDIVALFIRENYKQNKLNDDLLSRLGIVENKLDELTDKENIFKGMVLYEDECYKSYTFVKDLMLKAKKELIILDDYLDYSVLKMCDDLVKNVSIKIYTLPSSKLTSKDFGVFSKTHNAYLCKTNKVHYRLLIIDDIPYLFSHSFKDLGDKRSCVVKCEFLNKIELIKDLENK